MTIGTKTGGSGESRLLEQRRLNSTIEERVPSAQNWNLFSYYSRLGRVKRYVEAHIGDAISLEDAARVANLQRNYFCTYFREKAGVGFHEWLTGLRVARAQDLLLRSDISISQAAFAVGFQDIRTFQRAFRRITGLSASEYRKVKLPT